MLIIEGWLKLAAGEFDKVADAARTMVAETNREAGCLAYSFARDITDPDLIRIAERWESQEALAAHGQSAHMADIQPRHGRGPARRRGTVALFRRGSAAADLGSDPGPPLVAAVILPEAALPAI